MTNGKPFIVEAEERWTWISGYVGLYKVSSHGRVKSVKRAVKYTHRWGGSAEMNIPEKILSPHPSVSGYLSVSLCKQAKVKPKDIHRLVAKHFVKNPHKKPQVNHIDGNKKNNHYLNLEWCTCSENHRHAVATGLMNNFGENNGYSRAVVVVKHGFRMEFKTQREAAKYLGVKDINISCAKIKGTKCKGHNIYQL